MLAEKTTTVKTSPLAVPDLHFSPAAPFLKGEDWTSFLQRNRMEKQYLVRDDFSMCFLKLSKMAATLVSLFFYSFDVCTLWKLFFILHKQSFWSRLKLVFLELLTILFLVGVVGAWLLFQNFSSSHATAGHDDTYYTYIPKYFRVLKNFYSTWYLIMWWAVKIHGVSMMFFSLGQLRFLPFLQMTFVQDEHI